MKRAANIATTSAVLVMTGAVVVALAAGTAPPRVSTIPSIVTQRPVRQTAAAPNVAVVPVAVVPVVAAPAPARPVAAARRLASTLIAAARSSARSATRAKPAETPVTIVVAPRPTPSVDTSPHGGAGEHEVVHPKVRDESDDEEED